MSKRLIRVAPRGAGQVRPGLMREPASRPKFLGTGKRLSRVVRGTSSEDRTIMACFLVAFCSQACCSRSNLPKAGTYRSYSTNIGGEQHSVKKFALLTPQVAQKAPGPAPGGAVPGEEIAGQP